MSVEDILNKEQAAMVSFEHHIKKLVGNKITTNDLDAIKQEARNYANALSDENWRLRNALKNYSKTYEQGFVDGVAHCIEKFPPFTHVLNKSKDYQGFETYAVIPRDKLIFDIFDDNWKVKRMQELLAEKKELEK